MSPSIFALVNPAAGRGRSAKRVDHYLGLLSRHVGDVEVAVTQRAGEEVALVDAALSRDFRAIVAVGGDGTWSIVADRILRSGRDDVALGLLPTGTGNDFGKSLAIRYDRAVSIVEGIAQGSTRRVDVGRVEGRHFLNVVGFGFDIAVIDDAARTPLFKGDLLYRFCALRQLFRFRGLPLEISASGEAPWRADHLMLVIANGNYFGGSFHIAPNARLDDGHLDAVSILNAGPAARARLFARVAKGRHEGDSRVVARQSRRFRIRFPAPVRYEADGEVYTSRTGDIEVASVPAALNVFVPASGAPQAPS